MDKLDLKLGDNWVAEIGKAIKSARGLLVVLSPRSVMSTNVLDEVNFARQHGKVIFPVLMEPCELPFGIHSLQYIDFTKSYDAALNECQRSAIALLGSDATRTAATKQFNSVDSSPTPEVETLPLADVKILWVDDCPNNNRYERAMMEELGASFALCTDTADAIRALKSWRFDLVLSDMGRPSGADAGYVLLTEMRQSGNDTPFVIYASSNSKQHKMDAASRGASGCTNDPRELLELVFQALKRTQT